MTLLFFAFIAGAGALWWAGSSTPRAIFMPEQRRSIVERRQAQERSALEAAQQRASKSRTYGPLDERQRAELTATLARMKGIEPESPATELPKAA